MHKPVPSLNEIARGCHRTDLGTTLENLKQYLATRGVPSYGLQVNATDFRKLPLPAIEAGQNHFVLLLSQKNEIDKVYDPFDGSTKLMQLPVDGDPNFLVPVMTFSVPKLN